MAFVHKIRQVQLVGPKIRQLRKERKMTQTELAARIGIQQSDLSRMEKGEYRVSLDTLFKILAESNMTIGEFFDDVHRESLSPQEMQMISEFKELSPEDRREVRAFINFKRQQARRIPESKRVLVDDEALAEARLSVARTMPLRVPPSRPPLARSDRLRPSEVSSEPRPRVRKSTKGVAS